VSELERASLFFDIGELHGARYARAKRLLDIPLAVAGTVVLAVLVPLVLVANRVGNRGPLFFRQTRIGKGGRPFTLVKLRTMSDAVAGPGEWTAEADPRVTPFGRVLRATHLDELPQVLNILRGELGVVGPRPEQPHYVDELTDKLPFYRLRHLVRPGLTGWAQVKYGYAGSESAALEKLQYEFWYLRHQSLRTDARIVGRTLRSVLGSEGRGR
jgi:lipopolysaccharide/colanic/teichoic acid biosynthesis glycosyltransferase